MSSPDERESEKEELLQDDTTDTVSGIEEDEQKEVPETPENEQENIVPVLNTNTPDPDALTVPRNSKTSRRVLSHRDRGFVNGVKNSANNHRDVSGKRSIRRIRRKQKKKSIAVQAAVLIVALLLFITAIVSVWYFSRPPKSIVIDGNTGDWEDILLYSDTVLSSQPSIDIEEYSVYPASGGIYFYLKTRDNIFRGENGGWDALRVFVDIDRNADTGYRIEMLGADAMIVLGGYDGNIVSSALYIWNNTAGGSDNNINWSRWEYRSGVSAACKGGVVEGYAVIGSLLADSPALCHFVLSHYSAAGDSEYESRGMAYADGEKGSLVIEQQYIGGDVVSAGADVVEVKLSAKGKAVRIENIDVANAEVTLPQDVVDVGKDVVVRCRVKAGLSSGQAYRFEVKKVRTDGASYRLIGSGGRAYLDRVPAGIVIDGAFGDWKDIVKGTDLQERDDRNITSDHDLREYASVLNETSTAYFYMSVTGKMLAGAEIPVREGRPVIAEGGSGIVIKRENTGCDYARVYLDIHNSTGGVFETAKIREGYLVEISGRNGEVVESHIWVLKNGRKDTEVLNGNLKFGVKGGEIEFSIEVVGLSGIGEGTALYFETTDWRGVKDSSVEAWSFEKRSSSSGGGGGGARAPNHTPIRITGNSGFTNASGVIWGSGTEADPFIIEGWEIN
ncbi:MAG: hypothetical protein QW728_04760, partial [Thermoplasmata archaeon]